MKKTLLSLTLILTAAFTLSAQCKLEQDSVIAGESVSEHYNYYYDFQDRINKVTRIDSSQTTYFNYDTLVYNGTTGYLDYTYGMSVDSTVPFDTTAFTYDNNGRIIRIDASGIADGSYWALSHDVVYNGMEISDINLDPSSLVGDPEGLAGSFKNIKWSGGNMVNVDLEFDMGSGPIILELSGTYDMKNNIQKHFALSEASEFLFSSSKNNIVSLTLDKDVPGFGSAGDKAIDHDLTYNSNDEVQTLIENPSIFEDNGRTRSFRFNCVTGLNTTVDDIGLTIYPNPVSNQLNITQIEGNGIVSILNITGKVIYSENVNSNIHKINTSDYSRGVYFLRVVSEGEIYTHKFIKK